MITIGLVGGVASGKSVVASEFQKLGAGILNGDRIGHEVLNLPSVRDALVYRWGNDIVTSDGELDRQAIAQIVFPTPTAQQSVQDQAVGELRFLERVTHPEIGKILAARLEKMRGLDRFPVAVIDAAVMLKAGWDSLCDQIIFVDAPVALRRRRAQMRGLAAEQFEAREACQTPVSKKKDRADIIIDNSGPPQNTFRQVEEVWQTLLQIA